jgi:hypothetical protein
MKFFFTGILCLLINSAHSQLLSGEIIDANRKMTSTSTFTINSFYEGYVVYEIAVNNVGKVTSERFIAEKSTVKSTPANIEAKNLLKSLTFEPGDGFPKFHHAMVKIKFVKAKPVETTPKTK